MADRHRRGTHRAPSTVTTGPDGTYDFTVTIGTKPGEWKLNAWALNANLVPAKDKDHSAKTVAVSLEPLGKASVSSVRFIDALRELITSGRPYKQLVVGDLTNNTTLTTTLGQVAAQKGFDEDNFGGLAFAGINGNDGGAVLIYPANDPPPIDPKTGIVPVNGKDAADLVWSPNEWDSDQKLPTRDNNLIRPAYGHQLPDGRPDTCTVDRRHESEWLDHGQRQRGQTFRLQFPMVRMGLPKHFKTWCLLLITLVSVPMSAAARCPGGPTRRPEPSRSRSPVRG